MCTSIVEIVTASGAGKGGDGWFDLTHSVVSYDHPHHALLEEAITIDFVNARAGSRLAGRGRADAGSGQGTERRADPGHRAGRDRGIAAGTAGPDAMVAIQPVVHFSIPVSDVARSTRFYTEIVGCRHLATVAGGTMAFLDAAGTCLILVKRDAPINRGRGSWRRAPLLCRRA